MHCTTASTPSLQKFGFEKTNVALFGYSLNSLTSILEFFKIPFTMNPDVLSDYDVVLSYGNYGNLFCAKNPVICVPSDTTKFYDFLEKINVKATHIEKKVDINLRIKEAVVSLSISNYFLYAGVVDELISLKGVTILARIKGTNINLLNLDLVEQINKETEHGIDLKPNVAFKFSSNLKLANLIPRRFGDVLLKSMAGIDVSAKDYERHVASLDSLRYFLLAVLVASANRPFKTLNFWKKKAKYALMITHDVDTKFGFDVGISQLRAVEKELCIKSAWNIPTKHYALKDTVLDTLMAEGCEIGSHGHQHDGKLIFQDKNMSKTFLTSKKKLEQTAKCEIKGFRAPLLQHSHRILSNLALAGFTYDSSVPAWEAYCRTSGSAHGIGSLFPLVLEGLVELTVTMPQDHQLFKVAGLEADDAIELWKYLRNYIKSIGGLCNIILHPDESLFGKHLLQYYKRVLTELTADEECWLCLPSEIAEHWKFRHSLKLNPDGNAVTPQGNTLSNDDLNEAFGFNIYDKQDFSFEDTKITV